MSYEDFNKAVNETFFDGRFANAPVFLDLEGSLAEEVARRVGMNVDDLEDIAGSSVRETLDFDARNPYRFHQQVFAKWLRTTRDTAPPFTGLLCILSMAAERMRADDEFAAINYYSRLGEVLGIEDESLVQHLRAGGKYTLDFWRGLNLWLREHDSSLGIPTAQPVTNWRYVSYAISQALVRDADRERFHDLFETLGLSPGADVSEGEMFLYLHEWMSTHGPSRWLRKLWQDPSLRERVALAAVTELSHWAPKTRVPRTDTASRLWWVANLATYPATSLRLFLATNLPDETGSLALRLRASDGGTSNLDFQSAPPDLRLEPFPAFGLATLQPTGAFRLDQLLVSFVDLATVDSGKSYTHSPAPVIPLMQVEGRPYFREVSRVQLFKRCLVLCHSSWVDRVDNLLQSNAAPGYAKCEDVQGLPESWAVFLDVEMHFSADCENQLQALVPLSSGTALELTRGLRLAPTTWHGECPPLISASSEQSDFSVRVDEERVGKSKDVCIFEEAFEQGSAVVAVEDALETREGNFRVSIRHGRSAKSERQFSLRTADMPRAFRGQFLGYDVLTGDALNLLSAQPVEADDVEDIYVRGFRLPQTANDSETVTSGTPADLKLEVPLENDSGEVDDRMDEIPRYACGGGAVAAAECFVRNHHYWIVEAFNPGDDRFQAKRMRCKDCGLESMSRTWKSRRRRRNGAQGPARVGKERHISSTGTGHRPSIQQLEDALCYLGSGTWDNLARLAASCSDDPWLPRQLIREFRDSGLLDVGLGPSFQPTHWSVAPPTLVFVDESSCFLAGFRNRSLLDELQDVLGEARYELGERPGGASIHRWRGVSPSHLLESTTGVTDPLGRPVTVETRAVESLLGSLPSLAAVHETLPHFHAGASASLEQFDVRTNRWRSANSASEPGAYRVIHGHQRYAWRGDNGDLREGPHEAVKILEASRLGIALHGFDPLRREFYAAPGCEPPGLYSRVLFACSGEFPERVGHRLVYRGVGLGVASALKQKLYGVEGSA